MTRLIRSLAWLLAVVTAAAPAVGGAPARPVRLGVLAYRGADEARRAWQPTADYLTAEVPGHTFVVVPLALEAIAPAVARHELDFVATSPANYVALEARWGASRIVSLLDLRRGIVCKSYGAVIFTRAGRRDIRTLQDLRGKSFRAYSAESFGGWWMAWRELLDHGIDPHRDFAALRFGGTHDTVVTDVRDGRADAGTVRTDQLERMADEGKIDLAAFQVLNAQPKTPEFPFERSTRLYPQWPLATLKETPDDLAQAVAIALLKMPGDSPAARAVPCAGWTILLNFEPVHECLKALRREPYQDYGKVTLQAALRQYWPWLAAAAVAFALLLVTTTIALRLHRVEAARRQADVALRASETFYHALVESLPQNIFRKDREGRFTFGNRRYCDTVGRPREAILGRTDNDLFPPELAAKYRRDDAQVMQSGANLEAIEEHVTPDGQTHYVRVIKAPLHDPEGAIIGTQGIFWDVTAIKQAEAQLLAQNVLLQELARSERQVLEELKHAQSRMVQTAKLAGLGQMIAGVAHEINNPLAFVTNNVAVLERDVGELRELVLLYRQADDLLAQGRTELFGQIHALCERTDIAYTLENFDGLMLRTREGLRRIQQIVRDLRVFARVEESTLHEVDLNPGIESTVNIISGYAKKNRVQLVLDLGPLPAISCVSAKINQVVMNLVANAIDACDEGGTVTVRSYAEAGEVRIEVKDSGCGIPPEIRDKIFDPFFTTKPAGVGTGLGLSISYGIIQDHGGRIEVESTPGQGTCFTVHLPLRLPGRATEVPDKAQA